MRYVIEGTWSGYTSKQERVVHREVGTKKRAEAVSKIGYAIGYSDGTKLILSVRPAKPRERIASIPGYRLLIDKCILHNVNHVDALPKVAQ